MTAAVHILDILLVLFWSLIIKIVAGAVYLALLVSLIAMYVFIAALCVMLAAKPRKEPKRGP